MPDAVLFHRLDYAEVLRRELRFMDATAVSLCMDNDLPIVVFDLMGKGNVVRAVRGERIGTLVSRIGADGTAWHDPGRAHHGNTARRPVPAGTPTEALRSRND